MKIAVIYTVEERITRRPKNEHGLEQMNATTTGIVEALRAKGHEAFAIPATYKLLPELMELQPDCIFNNCTGIHDKKSQPQIAGLLELTNIPFTGSGQLTHNLALYKPLAKTILVSQNIPTPRYQVFTDPDQPLDPELQFPLIVKPEHEGSSIGISAKSVVTDPKECLDAVAEILENFEQPALVEEFVSGREFTVGVLGNDRPQVLPLVEINFGDQRGFYSHQVKAGDKIKTICPAQVSDDLEQKIQTAVLAAYQALGCCDYARVDVRITKDGEPRIIEVNTLPGLQKGYSDFPKAAYAAGISYEELINQIVTLALERFGKTN